MSRDMFVRSAAVQSTRQRRGRVRRSRSEWRGVFSAQEASELSAMEFCRGAGMAPSVFYRARKRMGWNRADESGLRPWAESSPRACAKPGQRFIELRVEAPAREDGGSDPVLLNAAAVSGNGVCSASTMFAGVEIVRGDGTRLALSRGFDAETLARAVAALSAMRAEARPAGDCAGVCIEGVACARLADRGRKPSC